MKTMIEKKSDTLKVTDRCDRCKSQAFVWINGVAGDLLFCRHHFLKHEQAIKNYAFEILDETWKINEKPGGSA